MQIIPFQKFVHSTKLWCFYMLPFMHLYTLMLAVLMLTYSHEHTFNRRNQDYD